jgi:hypothetical protein
MTTLILAAASALLYRLGGAGKEEIPFANYQYRDIGCPIVVLAWLLLAGFTWYLALASAALVCLLIRTYHDYTGADNMYLHGLGIGLAMTPLYWSGVAWYAIAAYAVILGLGMGLLNTLCTRVNGIPFKVWIEELSRGCLIIAAMEMLIFMSII